MCLYDHCWLMFDLVSARTNSFLDGWSLVHIGDRLLFLLRCKTFHFSLLDLMMFLSAHSSRLLRSFCMATPLSFCHQQNWSREFAPSPRSLMKMLKGTGFHTDSWCALLAPGLQLDFVLFITALWVVFRQFSVHLSVCLTSPFVNTLSMRILWEEVSETSPKSRQAMSTALPSSGQTFYHISLSSWSSMTAPWWMNADYSWWFSCSSCA